MTNKTNKKNQKVYFREQAQKSLLNGAHILAEAVGSTMGPSGHSVIIDNENGQLKITKDGVTVARSINLKDRLESIGAELLKEIAAKTNDEAGDGTTSATVLGFGLLNEGYKLIGTNRSAIDLKYGMDLAKEKVLQFLKDNCVAISDEKQISNVATISANGDTEIGELITRAIKAVGVDGLIAIENGKSINTSLKVAEGIQIDSGYLSPWFITHAEKQTCEFDNPYILITPNKISSIQDIVPILEKVESANRPLVIVADDVEGEAMHTLVVNNQKKVIRVCAIKAPSYGEFRADILGDLGTVVNAEILGATSEIKLEKIKLENLGTCKKIVINRTSTMIVVDNSQQTKDRIGLKVSQMREALKNDNTLDDLRHNKLKQRLAKLSGGIAIIEVGGSSEVEVLEKRDRVEDAVNATQAAVQEGIVPGGGTALFYASLHLNSLVKAGFFPNLKDDVLAGIQIVSNACQTPFNKIISNTGEAPEVISERLKQNWFGQKAFFLDIDNANKESLDGFYQQIEKYNLNPKNQKDKFNFGYNAATKKFTDLVVDGIVDPIKVTRHVVEHAVSVIGLTITCNAIIIEDE